MDVIVLCVAHFFRSVLQDVCESFLVSNLLVVSRYRIILRAYTMIFNFTSCDFRACFRLNGQPITQKFAHTRVLARSMFCHFVDRCVP